MMILIHTLARDGKTYNAKGTYDCGRVTVLKGSIININGGENFKPSPEVCNKRKDPSLVDVNGLVLQDILFPSLSSAACFVTGRSANGLMTWKTENGRYIRYALNDK